MKPNEDVLTLEDVQKVCGRKDIASYRLEPIGEAPIGFLGLHLYLKVELPLKQQSGSHIWKSFFVKCLPKNVKKQLEYIQEFGAFKKEAQFYKELLPALQLGVLPGSPKFAADSLFVQDDNVIVLENLTDEGYMMGTRADGTLDLEHMTMALHSLAQLHAASIVLERKTNKSIPQMFPGCLDENAYPDASNGHIQMVESDHIRLVGFRNACSGLSALIRQIDKYKNSPQLDVILSKFPLVMRQIFNLCKPSERYRNVVLHGDMWANNVLFKYDKVNGKQMPVMARLVDFQLARYAPPILDVITIITITSNSCFRDEHLDKLIEFYYSTLKHSLKQHGIDLLVEIPPEEFTHSYREYKLAGLIESSLFSHLTLLPKETSTAMVGSSDKFDDFISGGRDQFCIQAFASDENYRHRMTDILTQIVDFYILK